MSISLFKEGQRLYVTPDEREILLAAVKDLAPKERTLCETLAYTGCRISEALNLTHHSVDLSARSVVFKTLKQRDQDISRAVPVPDSYLDTMKLVHDLNSEHRRHGHADNNLWEWKRTKAWKIVKAWFDRAGVHGLWASPKGLRHGFAIHAITCGVPLTFIKRWLGHSSLETTEIYLQAIGPEEYEIAARMWEEHHGVKRMTAIAEQQKPRNV